MHFPSRPIMAFIAVSALLLPSSALAGTIGGWYLGSEVWTNLTSGVDGEVYAAVHDGDNLYVGGSFSEAGGVAAANIAQWNGFAWTNLGVGIDGTVSALAHDGTNLYVGGSFFLAGGESALNIAMWDGSCWTNLGAGIEGAVWALAHDGTNLYAGGGFSSAGETEASNIARWDGANWSPLGLGTDSDVYALKADPDGLLYAGGWFYSAGGVVANNIARWDGASWTNMGTGVNGSVLALAHDGTQLYAGGIFDAADGAIVTNMAVWGGSNWTNVGSGVESDVYALAYDSDGGKLYAGGFLYDAGGLPIQGVAEWGGSSWTNVAAGIDGTVMAMANDGEDLYVGGSFTEAGGTAASSIAKWVPPLLEYYGVSPTFGSWRGGDEVVLRGTDLGNGSDVTNVTICGVTAAILSQSATQIVVAAGAAPGAVRGDVRVYSQSLGESVKLSGFEYRIPGFQIRNATGGLMTSDAGATRSNGTAFDTLFVGQATTNRFSLANNGQVELVIDAVTLHDYGADMFRVEGLPTTLDAGATTNFTIIFAPTGRGRFYPEIRIANDSAVSPFFINLSGRGITFLPEVSAPTNQTAAVGSTVNFQVEAVGIEPFYYQWFKNGGRIPSANGSTLSFPSAEMTDTGVYYAVVTNAAGMCISLPASLKVGSPELLAWGADAYGQLGDGTNTTRRETAILSAEDAVTATAGEFHSLFVKGNSTLWAMGRNDKGQLGDGTLNNRSNAVAVVNGSNVVAVAAGLSHNLILKKNGALYAVGLNGSGQLGDGSLTTRTSPVPVWNGSSVVAIAAGDGHSLFVKDDGYLYAMGANASGQLGDGTDDARRYPAFIDDHVVAVAAGTSHSLFIKDDATLWSMGENSSGQLGDGTTTSRSQPVLIASDVAAVEAGEAHSLYLKNNGTLWAMGRNEYGQLGTGDTIGCTNAVLVAENVADIAAGLRHSLFRKNDGTVWAMGLNAQGQLGDASTETRLSPVRIPCLSLADIATGASAGHTAAIGERLPPAIPGQPEDQTVLIGGDASFAVTAEGFEPLYYQWKFEGQDLPGETSAILELPDVAFADAGGYSVVVSNFIGSSTSDVAVLTVDKLTPDVTQWPTASAITYGDTLAASTLSGGEASVTGSFAFAEPTSAPNAGTNFQSVVFTPDDTVYYHAVTDSVSVAVNKATPDITAWPTAATITYGQTLASSTLSGGSASVSGSFGFTAPSSVPNAGTAPYDVRFTPADTANYQTVISAVSVTVNKATPTVTTWPVASGLTYGQTLAASILSGGAASVPGTFAFAYPATIPAVGTSGHSVIFTPSDSTNYNSVNGAAGVTVIKATPTVTSWPTASSITYGQTLASSTLSGGSASVAGSFVFTTPSTAPSTGTASQNVTFLPTQSGSYNSVAGTASVTVVKAVPTVTAWPAASDIVYGQTLADSTLTGGSASVPGAFAFTTPTTAPELGAAPQQVTFTPSDISNYTTKTGTVEVIVGQATPVVTTWPSAAPVYKGQTLSEVILSGAETSVPGSFAFLSPQQMPEIGTASHNVKFTPTDNVNYITVNGAVDVTVLSPLDIIASPTNQVVEVGGTVALEIEASGSEPFHYQWFKGGSLMAGATNASLLFVDAGVTNSGLYYAVVTNAYSMRITSPAAVTVGSPELMAWGANGYGQLGFGTTADRPYSDSVASNVVSAAAGGYHTVFLKSDGTLWAMGRNADGELGDGSTLQKTSPVQVAGGGHALAIAAGSSHSLFIADDTTLWAMGKNSSGQLGDGTVLSRNNAVAVVGGSNVVAVAAGDDHSLFLRNDGTLWAMGKNNHGQLGNATQTSTNRPVAVVGGSNVAAIAAGGDQSLFLKRDGSLWAMGANGYGALGDGTTTDRSTPVKVAEHVGAVAAGGDHSLYVKQDGSLWSMGWNVSGALGDGTTETRTHPVTVFEGSNVVAATAGGLHSMFVRDDGTTWATGSNGNGQLGDRSRTNQLSAVAVSDMALATIISGGASHHSLAIGELLVPPSDFIFTNNVDGSITITGYIGDGGDIVIPGAIQDMTVAGIAYRAFFGSTTLTGVTLPDSLTTIGPQAFASCSALTSVVFGSAITLVGEAAFSGCTSLQEVTLPDSLEDLCAAAFSNCSSLTNVTFGTSLETLGDEAFSGCTSLLEVNIPVGVTHIGERVFLSCSALMNIWVDVGNPAYCSLGGILFDKSAKTLIHYPSGRIGPYTVPDGVETIGAYAFAMAANLPRITIPSSVTNLESHAFASCQTLQGVYVHGDAPTCPEDAFEDAPEGTRVYYAPTADGWGATFGGLLTLVWNAAVEAGSGFGMEDGVFGFNITGAEGMTVVVEVADDLATPAWTPVETNILTGGTSSFADPDSPNYPARFYRLRMP